MNEEIQDNDPTVRQQIDEIRTQMLTQASTLIPGQCASIGLLNEKGGVYKTTLSLTLAAALASIGLRVVLLDMDPQGHATMRFGLKKAPGVYNLMVRDAEWQDALEGVERSVYADPNLIDVPGELWVLPGNLETRGVSIANPDVFLLRNRMEELAGWADFIIVDTSPTPSPLNSTVYMAVDGVVLPTEPTFTSLDGLAGSILRKSQADRSRVGSDLAETKLLGIVPTAVREKVGAHELGVQQLTSTYKRHVWPSIPLRTVWEQAEWSRKSIFAYAPHSDGALHGWALAARTLRAVSSGEVAR
jgi:chromosome partitioning protein